MSRTLTLEEAADVLKTTAETVSDCIRRPGRLAHRAVHFDRHDFDTQRGRSMVAKVLMQLRRETRA